MQCACGSRHLFTPRSWYRLIFLATEEKYGVYYAKCDFVRFACDDSGYDPWPRRRGGAKWRKNVASGGGDGVQSMEEKADDAIRAVLGVQMLFLNHLCHHTLLFRHQLPTSQQALWRLRLRSQVMPLYFLLHLTVLFFYEHDVCKLRFTDFLCTLRFIIIHKH